MLSIFNDLEPFFQDNYRRINVREYARIRKISAPTASKLLIKYQKEGLLNREDEKLVINFTANKDDKLFIDLSRIYWKLQFQKIGLIEYLEKELVNPLVILFGSFSKAEVNENSDIDLAIMTPSKIPNLERFEKRLKKKIQVFKYDLDKAGWDKQTAGNLMNSVLNGYVILGSW